MNEILHLSYEYFELEGVPPYISPFLSVDFKYDWWVDVDDTRKFRFEKRFATRVGPPNSGLVSLTTSKDTESKIFHTEFWDGKPETIEREMSTTILGYTAWLETFTAMGRKLVAEIGQVNPTHTYLNIQKDDLWGDVHIFQKKDIVQASDLYMGLPLVITYKIHTSDFRWIEMEQKVISDDEVLFRFWRLKTWEEMSSETLPSTLFDHLY
jgi:hypothetical protein